MKHRQNDYLYYEPPRVYSEEEIKQMEAQIEAMTQYDMCLRWRFAKSGDPFFRRDLPLFEKFNKRFKELGGFTPEISKDIGWE
jgi:hypothetical protein